MPSLIAIIIILAEIKEPSASAFTDDYKINV
jgi:hypothetical protein